MALTKVYQRQNFKNNTVPALNAQNMNKIDAAIDVLDDRIIEQDEQILNCSKRMDNLVVNNQPTEGNAELVDMRIGADGVGYTSAGQAVREQLKQKASLSDVSAPYNYKGSTTYAALPTKGNSVNDTYYTTDHKCKYTWNGSGWYQSSMNESDYQEELSQLSSEIGDNIEEIDTINKGFYGIEKVKISNVTLGKAYMPNGTLGVGDNFCVSPFYEATEHEAIKIDTDLVFNIAWFDSKENFIIRTGASEDVIYGAKFRVSLGTNDGSVMTEEIANTACIKLKSSFSHKKELEDIRLSYDGRTYNTAGEAVREQFNNILLKVNNSQKFNLTNVTLGKAYTPSGSLGTGDNYCVSPFYNARMASAIIIDTDLTSNIAWFDAEGNFLERTSENKDTIHGEQFRVSLALSAGETMTEEIANTVYVTLEREYLKTKTLAVKGDSVVYGAGADACSWVDMINDYQIFAEVRKYGTSGMPLCSVAGRKSMVETFSSIKKSDYTIIAGGINDFNQSAPLGEFDDGLITTFKGALKIMIEGILTNNPTTNLCFITPIKVTSSLGDWNKQNDVGCTLTDYVNAIKEACELYSLPCYDAFANMGFNPLMEILKTTYQPDGTHPNSAGNERYARKIIAFLKNI